MNIISLLTEMEEEIKSANKYGKCYQHYKKRNPVIAKRYYEMALDETKHANFLHDIAMDKVNEMTMEDKTFTEFVEDMWEEKDSEYIEKMAIIKNMLSM